MMLHFKRLKEGHWPIFLLSNISAIVNMALPIILVRLFSPTEMGLYKTFFLYLSLIPFITMAGGPLNSIYYWIGQDVREKNEYIKSTWMTTTLLSSLIFIAGIIVYFFFRSSMTFSPSLFLMLLVSGFLICPSGHFCEVCIAEGKTILGAGLSMSFEVLKTGGFIFLAWKYRNMDMLFTYFFIMMILSSLLMIYLGIKSDTITFSIDNKRIKSILAYSLPISFSGFLLFVIDKADQFIISGLVPSQSFAYYSLGCLVIPPLYLLETSVQKHLIPKLSSHYTQQNFPQIAEDFRKAINDIAYLTIPAVFGLIFFAKPIITLLYTAQYEASVIFLQVFALSYLLLLIPHDSILRASGKTGSILKIYLMLTPLSLVTIFLSAKYFGIKWALVASIIIKLLPKIYCFVMSARIIKSRLADLIPARALLEFFSMSTILTLLSYAVKGLFTSELQWFLICAPLFAIIYLGIFINRQPKKT